MRVSFVLFSYQTQIISQKTQISKSVSDKNRSPVLHCSRTCFPWVRNPSPEGPRNWDCFRISCAHPVMPPSHPWPIYTLFFFSTYSLAFILPKVYWLEHWPQQSRQHFWKFAKIKIFLENSTTSWRGKMYDDESILTHFQAAGHLGFHLSKPFCISIFQWLWIVDSWGTQRKNWREILRIWMCPKGKQRLSCGLYKGCDFVTTLCVAPNHTWAFTGIQRDQNPSHKLRKTLTQTLRGKSAKPYKMYEKKRCSYYFQICSRILTASIHKQRSLGACFNESKIHL